MSCSDILLSFLADAGEDWAESFIFPEADGSIDVSDYLNKSDYVDEECPPSPSSCSSDVLGTPEDDKIFQEALDSLEFTDEEYASGEYLPFGLEDNTSTCIQNKPIENLSNKRKAESSNDVPVLKKKSKNETDEKISNVVSLLQKYKIKREQDLELEKSKASRRFKFNNSVTIAEAFLKSVLGCTSSATPVELLKLASPTATFQSKALSSLVAQAQSKKAQLKLSAWCPVNQSVSLFPESHTGIGQIAASSRGFSSAMCDIISQTVLNKLKFSVTIPKDSSVTSKYGDQLSSPFVWKSEGMLALGYPEELEFNGLIRCSFVREGISSAYISFDACKIIRQSQTLFQPTTSNNVRLV